jgi:hypothetical protein
MADEVTGGNNAIRFNQRMTLWNVSPLAPSAPAVIVRTQVDSGAKVFSVAAVTRPRCPPGWQLSWGAAADHTSYRRRITL